MPVFNKVNPGDVLYDVHREQCGNVRGMSREGTWEVYVYAVDRVKFRAFVSWNGNRKEWWSAHKIHKLRRKPGKDWFRDMRGNMMERSFRTTFNLPADFAVCEVCDGKGRTQSGWSNPSVECGPCQGRGVRL